MQIILVSMRFEPNRTDPILYVLKEKRAFILILIYVDDILIFFNAQESGDEMIKRFADQLEIRDSKKKARFLGISTVEEDNSIKSHSEPMVERMFDYSSMSTCKPATTLPPGLDV